MSNTRVALLIDADNLSGDVIEQAVDHLLGQFGAIHFRRAYSSPQKVIEHAELFRRLAIRPMVNLPTGKNSTDIALAVDAIDLAIVERPEVVVIGSSDSDYAPLAQRLREKGCRVLGIGQAGKTGSESPLAYDEFIDLAHRRKREAGVRRPREPRPTPDRGTAGDRTLASRPASNLPAAVTAILRAVPALATGQTLRLGDVGEALRREGLLTGKRASASGLLKRHAVHFDLVPGDRPRSVRFVGSSIEPTDPVQE